METKKVAKTLLLVGLGITAIGFGVKLYKQVMVAMNYCFRISKIRINKINQDVFDVVLTIRFMNKSALEATVSRYNLDIYLNDKKIATVAQDVAYKIGKMAVSTIEVPVSVSLKTKFTLTEVINLAANYLSKSGQDKIKIRVAGTIDAKAYGVPVKNVDIDVTMSLKEMLEEDPNAPVCPEKF